MPAKNPKQYASDHYQQNKDKYITSSVKSRQHRRDTVTSIKAAKGCKYCGVNHPAVLDFHHREPKEKSFTISSGINDKSLSAILAEIEKCDVVCSNCHRMQHYYGN